MSEEQKPVAQPSLAGVGILILVCVSGIVVGICAGRTTGDQTAVDEVARHERDRAHAEQLFQSIQQGREQHRQQMQRCQDALTRQFRETLNWNRRYCEMPQNMTSSECAHVPEPARVE